MREECVETERQIWYELGETAIHLSLSPKTVVNYVYTGRLKGVKAEKRWWFHIDDLDAYLTGGRYLAGARTRVVHKHVPKEPEEGVVPGETTDRLVLSVSTPEPASLPLSRMAEQDMGKVVLLSRPVGAALTTQAQACDAPERKPIFQIPQLSLEDFLRYWKVRTLLSSVLNERYYPYQPFFELVHGVSQLREERSKPGYLFLPRADGGINLFWKITSAENPRKVLEQMEQKLADYQDELDDAGWPCEWSREEEDHGYPYLWIDKITLSQKLAEQRRAQRDKSQTPPSALAMALSEAFA